MANCWLFRVITKFCFIKQMVQVWSAGWWGFPIASNRSRFRPMANNWQSLVAIQRFVDNITSITPGALKGGLMTVCRHPKKDELLIGGADGAPKIYKMHREKKRVIGDDFNHIRTFETMAGRIFAARYSADGT